MAEQPKTEQCRILKIYHGSYVLSFFVMITIIIGLSAGLYAWLKHNLWDSVIPYTVETTIVANSQSALANNNSEYRVISPLTISQEIIVNSDDLDTLYQELEAHIDSYLSFAISLFSIVITGVSICVPLFNYFFLHRDTVKSLQKSQDMSIKNAQIIAEQYADTLKRITTLADEIEKAEERLTAQQSAFEMLQTNVDAHQTILTNIDLAMFKEQAGSDNYPTDKKEKKDQNDNPTKRADLDLKTFNDVSGYTEGTVTKHSIIDEHQNAETKCHNLKKSDNLF